MKIGYKVVTHRGVDTFGPATHYAFPGTCYKLGETTYRERDTGPFAVFKQYKDAAEFMDVEGMGDLILEVIYEESQEGMLWWIDPSSRIRNTRYLSHTPFGTVLADTVLPIRIMDFDMEDEDE